MSLPGDQKLFAILTGDPSRRFATTGPCAAAIRITIFRRYAGTRTASLCSLATTAAEFGKGNAVVGHFLLDFVKHFRIFTRLRFFDLPFQLFSLREEFLVGRHRFPCGLVK